MLSIDVSFVFKLFWKGDKNFKNQTSGPIYMEDPVYSYGINLVFTKAYLLCLNQEIQSKKKSCL